MDEKIKQVLWFCFYSRNKKTCKSFETDGEGACNGGDSGRRKVRCVRDAGGCFPPQMWLGYEGGAGCGTPKWKTGSRGKKSSDLVKHLHNSGNSSENKYFFGL